MQNFNDMRNEIKSSVLIVDDEEIVLEFLAELLEISHNYQPYKYSNAEEAFKHFKLTKPDIVVTDLHMLPDDGITFICWIREIDPVVPIIVISGFNIKGDWVTLLKLGVDCFLRKPFKSDQFLLTIENLLNQSEVQRENRRLNNLLLELNKTNDISSTPVSDIQDKNIPSQKSILDIDDYNSLLAIITHEIRNPISAISGFANLIHREAIESENNTMLKYSDKLMDCINVVNNLFIQMMDIFLYVNVGEGDVSISEIMDKLESVAADKIPKSINLGLIVDENIKEMKIRTNIERLIRVVAELIENAGKAILSKSKSGNIQIEIYLSDSNLVISVLDDGPGIPQNIMPEILKTRVSEAKGLGLGLFLSGKNIAALGGKIIFENRPIKGAHFSVVLPRINKTVEG